MLVILLTTFSNSCAFAQTYCEQIKNKQKKLRDSVVNLYISYDRLHVKNTGDLKLKYSENFKAATRTGLYGQDLTIDFVIIMQGDSTEQRLIDSNYVPNKSTCNLVSELKNIFRDSIRKDFVINTTVTLINPIDYHTDPTNPLKLKYGGMYGDYLVKHYTDLEYYGRQTLVALKNTLIKQPLFNQAFAVLLAYGVEHQFSAEYNIVSSEISINRLKTKPPKSQFKIEIVSQIVFKDLYIEKYKEIKLLEANIKTLEDALIILKCSN